MSRTRRRGRWRRRRHRPTSREIAASTSGWAADRAARRPALPSEPQWRTPFQSQTSSSSASAGVTAIPYRAISAASAGCCARENHAPPSSTETPASGQSRVHVRPPTRSRASRSVTSSPCSAMSRAATSPAIPPPITTTSRSTTPPGPKGATVHRERSGSQVAPVERQPGDGVPGGGDREEHQHVRRTRSPTRAGPGPGTSGRARVAGASRARPPTARAH